MKSYNHTLSLRRPTSSSSSCLLVRVILPLLFVTSNCFTYIAEERTRAYSKHISRNCYPASLLALRSDLQKSHVTWSLSTVVTSSWTRKTQLPLLLRARISGVTYRWRPSVVANWNMFTELWPGNAYSRYNIYNEDFLLFWHDFLRYWNGNTYRRFKETCCNLLKDIIFHYLGYEGDSKAPWSGDSVYHFDTLRWTSVSYRPVCCSWFFTSFNMYILFKHLCHTKCQEPRCKDIRES
jgi:hypothetical protein